MQIIRLTGATFYGSGSGVAINGAVAVAFQVAPATRAGRSDGAMGDLSVDVSHEAVTGSLIIDDDDEDLALLVGTIGGLKLSWVTQGGAAATTWIGRESAVGGGVFFTGTGEMTLDQGEGDGPTIRTTLNFIGIFTSAMTKVISASAGTGIDTTALIEHSTVT
jgi:hypothetical protein